MTAFMKADLLKFSFSIGKMLFTDQLRDDYKGLYVCINSVSWLTLNSKINEVLQVVGQNERPA